MTDTCKNCGRPRWPAGALSADHMGHCRHEYSHDCEVYAVGYMRGRSDGIDDGVRIAKEHVITCCLDCRWTQAGTDESGPDWGDVDAEAEKAKGE